MHQSDINFSEWDVDIVLHRVRHKPSQLIFELRHEKNGGIRAVVCINASTFIQSTINAKDELPRILTEAKAVYRLKSLKV